MQNKCRNNANAVQESDNETRIRQPVRIGSSVVIEKDTCLATTFKSERLPHVPGQKLLRIVRVDKISVPKGSQSESEKVLAASKIRFAVTCFVRAAETNSCSMETPTNLLHLSSYQTEISGALFVSVVNVLFLPTLEVKYIDDVDQYGMATYVCNGMLDLQNQKLSKIGSAISSLKSVPPAIQRKPLRCLDLFAGCGGLTLGLEMSKLTSSLWALDSDPIACKTFAENFQHATVFQATATDWLKELRSGQLLSKKGQRLPQRGDVEMIVGGPPCQGFSHLNRFKTSSKAAKNKSQVPAFLDIVAFYKPECFLMENVKSFITEEGGKHFFGALQTTKEMGYYFRFMVLQAADFGAPQQRPRFFLFGTLDIGRLAGKPIATHFSGLTMTSVKAGNHTLSFEDKQEAYFQKVSVFHAIGDLPDVETLESSNKSCYNAITSTFQSKMRVGSEKLRMHKLPTSISPEDKKRMTMIPQGSDWRCLPRYEDEERFKAGMPLAPKSLVKSAHSNGDWRGAYGRLQWSDLFMTVLTRPCIASKTGKIIHPMYHRTLSLREYARAQTFPDRFKFKGALTQVQKQVGYHQNSIPFQHCRMHHHWLDSASTPATAS
ncbi:DNA (cytosine-5)-methyltransferase PliMCI-like [Cloeon dipterum]|uniref:DNA (cytosine-5)-methyltransferase PliMCI-like n=1 Tax=Cloeon dipterum TaxID=197152 RepID=UPI0032202D61